jgi:hypothetical protein
MEHRRWRGADSREAEIFLKILFKNIYILFGNIRRDAIYWIFGIIK